MAVEAARKPSVAAINNPQSTRFFVINISLMDDDAGTGLEIFFSGRLA